MVAASRPNSSGVASSNGAWEPMGLSRDWAASAAAGREKTSFHEYPFSQSFKKRGTTENAPQMLTPMTAHVSPPPATRSTKSTPENTEAHDTRAARVALTSAAS